MAVSRNIRERYGGELRNMADDRNDFVVKLGIERHHACTELFEEFREPFHCGARTTCKRSKNVHRVFE